MDPALRELLGSGRRRDSVEAILRLHPGAKVPEKWVRPVTRFGDILTVRLRRGDIFQVWSHPSVKSLKAARVFGQSRETPPTPEVFSRTRAPTRQAHPRHRGQGVVLGVIDWGFDIAHPAFRDAAGQSRVLALWDQREPSRGVQPKPYGYGRVITRREIDRALTTSRPYERLDYHPGDADRGRGAHGTHVADIAGGSPRSDGEGGLAPEADLVFVHLSAARLGGLSDLGNSARIIEAVDFIRRLSRGRGCVINMSLGRQGGAKNGTSLVERALDAFVTERDDAAIVQSAGNYFLANCHAAGVLPPGHMRWIGWDISRHDPTDNEMEIFYSARDRMRVSLRPPGQEAITVPLGDTRSLRDVFGREIARVYHRALEPNSGDHHCDIFVYANAPGGRWTVEISADVVTDGRYDVWIERDGSGPRRQSRLAPGEADQTCTIGSIASGYHSIVVGAAQQGRVGARPARFASAGPTRDGRTKPDVVAPGVAVRAARNTPLGESHPRPRHTHMSGASQAAPFVAGLLAACLSAAGPGQGIHDLRRMIIGTARPQAAHKLVDRLRLGAGLVDPQTALRVAEHSSSHPIRDRGLVR